MKKTVVLLKGGLGNQMFQYAFARSISLENSSELVIDNWSGFTFDYKYHRQYELGTFSIVGRPANLTEKFPFWFYELKSKFFPRLPKVFQQQFYGLLINEVGGEYIPEIEETKISQNCWLNGYWQSPLYFQKHSDSIARELMPPEPMEKHFFELGKLLRQTESVALGIRLYEESKNPGSHSSSGELKSHFEINQAILKLRELCNGAKFFVFCTHRSPLLQELALPENTIFVTHDDGYVGSMEIMWLLTQCKHHIFTNSTFYWWGAWLSQKFYIQGSQIVFAADNFINSDAIPKHWNLF
ncbi:alpha-1,2-fucosyltransferase [Cylindrospermopsis raciborskii]|uniref:alpha-1,2-fucosyltransferase n=1 Tax=Cylindrospermopsis raciborskii TaxID=77022 RepID=UPI001BA8DEB7|nr:alpha-1,2-fucosyltransferase [Cylindrospermopsis raciborskii]